MSNSGHTGWPVDEGHILCRERTVHRPHLAVVQGLVDRLPGQGVAGEAGLCAAKEHIRQVTPAGVLPLASLLEGVKRLPQPLVGIVS